MATVLGYNVLLSGEEHWIKDGSVSSITGGYSLTPGDSIKQSLAIVDAPNKFLASFVVEGVTEFDHLGFLHITFKGAITSSRLLPLPPGPIVMDGQTLLELPIELSLDSESSSIEIVFKIVASNSMKITQIQLIPYVDSTVENLRTEVSDELTSTKETITAMEGIINLKAEASVVTAVEERMGQAELAIDALKGSIVLKATTETVNALEQRIGSAEVSIDGLNTTINLKAEASTVTSLGTRVTTVETGLNAATGEISNKVSITDYNGNTITSLMNQTASTIKLKAEKIEFVGQVFGEGAIFKGNIETLQSVKVGSNIEMQGNGGGLIRFPFADCSIGADATGDVTISAWNDLVVVATSLDLTYTSVVWGANRPTAVWA